MTYGDAFREFGLMLLMLAVMVICVGGTFLPFWLTAWWLSGKPIPTGDDAEGPWPVAIFGVGIVVALMLGIPLVVATLETFDRRARR